MPEQEPHGIIRHTLSSRRTDYLYRISIKGLIRNDNGEVLVVKEGGRQHWDLPGGGMDHSEGLKSTIAREMKEEVNLIGDFSYRIISIDEPGLVKSYNFWQVRLIFELKPANMSFSAGEDGDEIAFIHPEVFKDSTHKVERWIHYYSTLT